MRHALPLLALTLLAAPAGAQREVHGYGDLVLSPRGDRVAAIEPAGGSTAIVERDAASGRVVATIDPCAACSYSGLAFAPDGSLAFLQRDRSGQARVQVMLAAAGGKPRLLATVDGIAQTPRFSPDGRSLALLVTIGATKEAGATQAGARQIGEIGEKSDEQRLAVVDLAASDPATALRLVSPADRYIYEYDWTPDGRGFAVTSALGNGDNNWWVATLDAVDLATGAVRPIARPPVQINQPRVSPDGRSVAFIGGLMSDFGSIGGDVYTVPFAGGTPADATTNAKMTFITVDWTAGGLRTVALAGDRMEVGALTPGRPVSVGYSQPVSLAAGDGRAVFSADGRTVATVAQDYTHAPAVYAGPIAAPRAITHDNDALPAHVRATSVHWRNEGFDVQGWLLAPLDAPSDAKAPMVTVVHGGPSAATTPSYLVGGSSADLLAAGYYLFMPNPRGSYGQGEAFTAANKRDFGGGDLRDILAGIDAAEKQAPIDDNRLGLSGCSYGGFMAMWANTQTNRFKAIVAGAGLSNWVSYYGTNGIDQWMLPFFGKSVYQDYKAYEDASAVYYVKKARTPTFIYVGERDIEVPPTQSIEWWHALKAENVPVSLVIYPDAGHCVPRPDQNADVRRRAVAWFDQYLKPVGTPAR